MPKNQYDHENKANGQQCNGYKFHYVLPTVSFTVYPSSIHRDHTDTPDMDAQK